MSIRREVVSRISDEIGFRDQLLHKEPLWCHAEMTCAAPGRSPDPRPGDLRVSVDPQASQLPARSTVDQLRSSIMTPAHQFLHRLDFYRCTQLAGMHSLDCQAPDYDCAVKIAGVKVAYEGAASELWHASYLIWAVGRQTPALRNYGFLPRISHLTRLTIARDGQTLRPHDGDGPCPPRPCVPPPRSGRPTFPLSGSTRPCC